MESRQSVSPRVLALGVSALVVLGVFLVQRRDARDGKSVPRPEAIATPGIQVTRGVKHTVPLNEIMSGGVPRDGIPAIDAPTFAVLPDTDPVLADEGIGLALVIGDDARFYPYQILVWHEIVNDTVGGQPVAVTYCPLCFTGIVFDRRVEGQETTFGTSGKLWQSNLVMYDRAAESYWSQVTGEAIKGERAGTKLTVTPADTMPLRVFRERHPRGKVLTTDTGHRRDYAHDPYEDFYASPQRGIGVTRLPDERLPAKEVVMGVTVEGTAVAIPVKTVLERREVTGRVGSTAIVARGDQETQSVQVFARAADGTLARLPAFPVFWFSWAASHPGTIVIPAP